MNLIILCGGKGTRLRSLVSDVPKPLAPVNDKVFLDILLSQYRDLGFERIILSAGYLSEKISSYLQKNIEIEIVIEDQVLGTGGAICNIFKQNPADKYFIVNGDTHYQNISASFIQCLKSMRDSMIIIGKIIDNDETRYKKFQLYDGRDLGVFNQKRDGSPFISLGMYIFHSDFFLEHNTLTAPFGIDEAVEALLNSGHQVKGVKTDLNFIDIGVPEDYLKFIKLHS